MPIRRWVLKFIFLYDSTEPCGLSRTICACGRQTEQASYLCLARWLIEQRFPRTCSQQIADRSLPVAEMLFRIGTLSRWVRAAASLSPGFDPAVRGGLGDPNGGGTPTGSVPLCHFVTFPPHCGGIFPQLTRDPRGSRLSLHANRVKVLSFSHLVPALSFSPPKRSKNTPIIRGSVSTLRFDTLHAWAEMGPGRFPHCVGEMSRSDKGKIPPRGGGNVMK